MDGTSWNRRRFLGGGLLLAAAWATGALWGHRALPARSSPFLGSGPLGTLFSAFEALLPTPEDARLAADGIDSFLAGADPVAGEQLRLALRVLEHASLGGPLGFRRFSRLDVPTRGRVLESWERSRLGLKRQVAGAVRKLAFFSHYSAPRSWTAIGYDGPWVESP